jgi:uncharacterized protein YbcI
MAISNEMVRIYKEQFGRGPTKTRTHWCGNDVITVVLEDTLTPAERNLVKLGEHQRLRDVRMFFQYATVAEFCAPIEENTGRKVRAFVSGLDTEVEGLAVELFVLHPEGYDGVAGRPLLADELLEQALELRRRVAAQTDVHRRGLDRGAGGRDDPRKSLRRRHPRDRPGRRVARRHARHGLERAPQRRRVGVRSQRAQPLLVEPHARRQEAGLAREQHDARVELLAALDPRHHPQ